MSEQYLPAGMEPPERFKNVTTDNYLDHFAVTDSVNCDALNKTLHAHIKRYCETILRAFFTDIHNKTNGDKERFLKEIEIEIDKTYPLETLMVIPASAGIVRNELYLKVSFSFRMASVELDDPSNITGQFYIGLDWMEYLKPIEHVGRFDRVRQRRLVIEN